MTFHRRKTAVGVACALGINNLFDTDPPFSDDETQGYDFTTHNPVGRFFCGRVKYAF